MPTLLSHTHLQATQSQAQAKACKRVRLPNRTIDRQTVDRKEQRRHNIGLAKWRVTCFYGSLVVKQKLVFQMNFCANNPPLRQAKNRYRQA
jgi:hypothetical protein